jgi:hypothetical protein
MGNPYGFDRTFYLRDLDYRGPKVGWGIVPDQYSLAVAHEQFVETAEAPFFLFFETATPHAPWSTPPPPVVSDPATLNRPVGERGASASRAAAGAREPSSWATRSKTERLFRHIQYDWRVLADYLHAQAPPSSLVVVVGDHQPYFANTESPATPVHVLSRDRGLVRRFRSYGFVPGLRLSPKAHTLHHAGLYSLLVRVLTAHDRAAPGDSSTALPPYHPRGVERPALLPKRP